MYEYFKLCGYDMDAEDMVLDADGKVPAEELENSFNAYYDAKGEANKLRVPKAFHIMGTLNPDGGIFLTHGIIDLKEFLARVKERGVTVSAYVAALLIACTAKDQGLNTRRTSVRSSFPFLWICAECFLPYATELYFLRKCRHGDRRES